MRIYHHSRNIHDRNPQGAVPCGTMITISCDYVSDEGEPLHLYWCDYGGIRVLQMQQYGERASVSLCAPYQPQRAGYCFCRFRDGRTFFYGGESGESRSSDKPLLYGVTVYDGSFTTPDWFKGAVAYQIFPDRFYCSDRNAFYARAREYRRTGRSIVVHEDWDDEPLYRPHGGKRDYEPDDYYGGDLEGIRQKLPYLQSLGVTCLYLNPIFEAHSNHRYNTADYYTVDPLLGTNVDFIRLCSDAETYGIRIILDGVFSHTGDDSIYFDRFGRYGTGACSDPSSPYREWYRFRRYPDEYECWWNFRSLPNVEEMTPSYREFIQGENGVLRTWLRRGASGWRLDVADELPDEFIRGTRRAAKYEKHDSVLLGEVWEDCSTKMGPEGRRGYCNGDELDAPMNYPFLRGVRQFLCCEIDAYALNDRLQRLRENYPKPFYEACLNLLGSHDIGRAISAFAGAPDSEATPREQQLLFHPTEEAITRAKIRYRSAVALAMVLPGVPCLYYGDEAGQTGMRDPFNRKTYPWGHADHALIRDVAALGNARHAHSALKDGRLRMGAVGRDLFAVIRYNESETVLCFLNRSDSAQSAVLFPTMLFEGPDGEAPVAFAGEYEAENGERIRAGASIRVSVPPCGFRLLIKSNKAE
ncbi:MAG: glycoside hydrolase family 13 protein [Clostridia bacterium]|nr:glycoside hydrolase family 13 protein [Clostridia bacterium]